MRWASPPGAPRARAGECSAGSAVGQYCEVTSPPTNEMGGLPLRDGRHGDDPHRHARLRAGATSPPSRRLLSTKLGVPFEAVRLLSGRQRRARRRRGATGGSKSLMASGAQRSSRRGGHRHLSGASRSPPTRLEASPGRQSPSRTVASEPLVRAPIGNRWGGADELGRAGAARRRGFTTPRTCRQKPRHDPRARGPRRSAYPNGCHVCEVEIDPQHRASCASARSTPR